MLIISTKDLYKYLSGKSRGFLFFLKNRLSTRLRTVNPHRVSYSTRENGNSFDPPSFDLL